MVETAQECLDYGFATEIADQEDEEDEEIQQTAFMQIRQSVLENKRNDFNTIMQKLEEIQSMITQKAGDPKDLDGQKQTGNKGNDFMKTFFNNLV